MSEQLKPMHIDTPYPLLVVFGPTASGKSALAEGLAQLSNFEIISCDSMQVYKGMNIGTAKVDLCHTNAKYHCLDICEPNDTYSAALFQSDSRYAIEKISKSNNRALLCGGTFFYIRACINDMDLVPGEQKNNPIRQKYESYLKENGPYGLYDLLKEKDSLSASYIHPNNSKRVIRALEMLEYGQSYSERAQNFKEIKTIYDCIKIALDVDVEILNKRINERVDQMFNDGLVEEVKNLVADGFKDSLTSSAAIGYKEVIDYFDGLCTLDEAKEQIKLGSRRYAKRQRSWMRSESELEYFDANKGIDDELLSKIYTFYLDRSQKFR
ncbi:MAG: tRNA (adenosine(37)-N6)-dimethylallyltransferase MiaA [Coriobacteriales bacterium]|nr:tRNA (adenosine(37)-N6)-dimethylallyltransferase MiaA [Coriobacteriales bacterium]